MRFRFLLAVLLCCLLPAPAAAKSLVAATWNGEDTTVDGLAEDWAEAMVYHNRSGVHMGARNDDRYLYICIFASDPSFTGLALEQGLTLSLKAKGRPPFKIKFPVATESRGAGALSPDVFKSPGLFVVKGEDKSGKGDQSFSMENDMGILLKIGADMEVFTYEFKVPLLPGESTPHAIGIEPGGIMELRLESPPTDLSGMAPGASSGRPGGAGYGGAPNSGGTLPGMGMPNPGAAPLTGLALKTRIQLATPPAQKAAPGK